MSSGGTYDPDRDPELLRQRSFIAFACSECGAPRNLERILKHLPCQHCQPELNLGPVASSKKPARAKRATKP